MSADKGLTGAAAGARRGSWSVPQCCTPSRPLTTSTGSGTAKAAGLGPFRRVGGSNAGPLSVGHVCVYYCSTYMYVMKLSGTEVD